MAVNLGYDNGYNDWKEGYEAVEEPPDDYYNMEEVAPPLPPKYSVKPPLPPKDTPEEMSGPKKPMSHQLFTNATYNSESRNQRYVDIINNSGIQETRKTGCKRPPWWAWAIIIIGLVLISLTAAISTALFLIHGSSDDSPQAASVVGASESTSKIPETTTVPTTTPSPHPVASAYFILECDQPIGHAGYRGFHGLCWKDTKTLIGIQHFAQQVVKFDVDIKRNNCISSIIDSGYKPMAVSCAPGGDIFVTDYTNNTVHIYDKFGRHQVWKLKYINYPEAIAVTRSYIIVSHPASLYPVNLYKRNKVFIRQSAVGGGRYRMDSIFLTEDGILMATTALHVHKLLMYNINTASLVETGGLGRENGQLHGPKSVWPVFGNTILVCDRENQRTSAFSYDGKFLYNLRYYGGSDTDPSHIAVIPRVGSSSLMAQAFSKSLKIYSLKP